MSSSASRSLKDRRPKRSDAQGALNQSIRTLPGVGTKREDLLRGLGIATVGDLLVYPPRRYIDRTTFSRIADLHAGEVQTVVATVSRAEVKPAGGRRLFIDHIKDASGEMRCVWFNQSYLRSVFRPGDAYVFSGKAQVDRFGRSMIHPEYEKAESELLHTGRIVPVYSTRPGLGQKQLRMLARHALDTCLEEVADCLPASIRRKHDLAPLTYSLRNLHFPADLSHAEAARRRLAFDEALVFQSLFAMSRLERSESSAPGHIASDAVDRFARELPFDLTASQAKALGTILDDIKAPLPMRRLLQGDVGCGKTVVAALAAATVCDAGGQVALMCPTELLAEQHYQTFNRFMTPLGFRTGLVTGGMMPAERADVEERIESGSIDVAVGTHALIGDRARFRDLQFVIVDEEQRFGVIQRTALLRKAPHANALVVSATPIPRTLALTAYGDLDVTVIGETPPGRGKHMSRCAGERSRRGILERVARMVESGLQGFYVCPSVEKGEAGLMDVGNARKEVVRHLRPGLRVEILTGRTPREERLRIVEDFRAGRIAVIVATTVIEVGMDIPSATLLVVDQADRFGLSQLHQMRGRVARSEADSYSYFIVSESADERASERVAVLEATFDGFEIAEKDLMFRGPGDIVGTRQHGVPDLKFARLPEDTDLMLAARDEAFGRVLGNDTSEEWQIWLKAVRSLATGRVTIA
jgi:ATP-dependent DNA helicase RecG